MFTIIDVKQKELNDPLLAGGHSNAELLLNSG